jgi:hypothetical protein
VCVRFIVFFFDSLYWLTKKHQSPQRRKRQKREASDGNSMACDGYVESGGLVVLMKAIAAKYIFKSRRSGCCGFVGVGDH